MRIAHLLPLLAPALLAAQELPPYVPVNPALSSRSALYAQPIVEPGRGWKVRLVTDYTNAVEVALAGGREYNFDAEILQSDLWVTRDLSPRAFVLANVALRGGYDGGLDGFLNWYHDLIGFKVPARNRRFENRFGWDMELPDGRTIVRHQPGTFLGDLRLGLGVRRGRAQLVGTVTLPTTTTKEAGWGRDAIGTALALTVNLKRSERWQVDGGLTLGYTPATGELEAYQRTVFHGGMLGARWRFAGKQALFATLFAQSGSWEGTGFNALESREVTLDFGGLLHLKQGWPELQLGMTEDLAPRGPAVDAGFKVGLRWK